MSLSKNENFAIINALICILSMFKLLCEKPGLIYDKEIQEAAGKHIDSTIKQLEEIRHD